MQDGIHEPTGTSLSERVAAGSHFVKHHSQRKNVRAGVYRPAQNLLGAHVLQRSHQRSGQRSRLGAHFGLDAFWPLSARDSEVQDFDPASIVDHDVRRLDVAVNDAPGVRFVQGVRRLNTDLDDLAGIHRLALHPLGEGLPGDVLHHDEGRPAGCLSNLVNDTDIRVVESRGGLGFFHQASQPLRILCQLSRQKLESDHPIELGIASQIHLPHAARAQTRFDSVMRDERAWVGRNGRHFSGLTRSLAKHRSNRGLEQRRSASAA